MNHYVELDIIIQHNLMRICMNYEMYATISMIEIHFIISQWGNTALYYACLKNATEIVRTLLEGCAEKLAKTEVRNLMTDDADDGTDDYDINHDNYEYDGEDGENEIVMYPPYAYYDYVHDDCDNYDYSDDVIIL